MGLFNFSKKKKPDRIDFSYKEFLNDGDTTMDEQIYKQHSLQLEKLEDKGKILGQRTPSEPSADSNIPHGIEHETRSFYQRLIHNIKKICSDKLAKLDKQHSGLLNQFKDMIKRKDKLVKDASEMNKKKKEIEETKNQNIFSQMQNTISDKIRDISDKIMNLRNITREINEQLAKDHESMPSKKRKKVLSGILITLGILDFPMNYKTLLLWRDDVISTLLLSTLFSLIIPFGSHAFGAYLKKNNPTHKDKFWIVISVLSAIAISWFVGDVRYDYLKEKNIEILSVFGYSSLNFIIFIIGAWVSYHLSFKNPEKVKSYFNFTKKLEEAEAELENLKNQNSGLEDSHAQKNLQVVDVYADNAESQFDSNLDTIKNKVISCEQEYNAVLTAVQGLESIIQSYYEEAVYKFRSSNESWRTDGKTPAYWQNSLTPLKMYFADKDYKNSSFDAIVLPQQNEAVNHSPQEMAGFIPPVN